MDGDEQTILVVNGNITSTSSGFPTKRRVITDATLVEAAIVSHSPGTVLTVIVRQESLVLACQTHCEGYGIGGNVYFAF